MPVVELIPEAVPEVVELALGDTLITFSLIGKKRIYEAIAVMNQG